MENLAHPYLWSLPTFNIVFTLGTLLGPLIALTAGTGRGYCLHWKHSVRSEGQFRVHSAWNSVCMRATPSHTLYARTPRRQLKQFQFTAMADRRARVLAFCREQRSQDRRRSHHRRLSVQRRRVLNLRMRRAVKSKASYLF